jgi:hypothetical protein
MSVVIAGGVLGLALAGAYLLWWVDRYDWEPLPRFALTFLLAVAAGVLLWRVPLTLWWQGFLVGWPASQIDWLGVWRDTALYLGILIVVLGAFSRRSHLDGPLDGLIFGVAAGTGLAATGLVSASWVSSGSHFDIWVTVISIVPAGCAVGLGVGWARLRSMWWRQLAQMAAGVAAGGLALLSPPLVAELSERAGATPAGWVWAVEVGVVLALPLVVVATFAWLLIGSERRLLERSLGEEAGFGVIPDWLPGRAARLWRRSDPGWWPRRDERQTLNRLLVELAIKKERVTSLGPEAARVYGLEVGRLRHRLRLLLDPAAQAESPVPD